MAPLVKNLPAKAGDIGASSSIPGLGRSPREGNGNPLQYSCLENLMDRGTCWATVHGLQRFRYEWSNGTQHRLPGRGGLSPTFWGLSNTSVPLSIPCSSALCVQLKWVVQHSEREVFWREEAAINSWTPPLTVQPNRQEPLSDWERVPDAWRWLMTATYSSHYS